MTGSPVELFISAGEISGDLHGARVLEELHRHHPSLKAFGIGGPRLLQAGQEQTAGIEELSLVGITEVVPRLRSILRLYSDTRRLLSRRRPAAVLLVDSPDFNLRLARHARSLGIKTVYYIGPTVWAWRKGRIEAIRESVDLMLTVLPFEEELYRRHGVRSRFVGHPLVDIVRSSTAEFSPSAFLAELGVSSDRDIVALLPGSRNSEVRQVLPVIIEAARLLTSRHPSLHFLVPAASPQIYDNVRSQLAGVLPNSSVVHGRAADCLASSRAAVVTSGTATLEAALLGTPFVTVYRLSLISYLIGKMLVTSPYISLPNILAGASVVKELIQHDCRPDKVADETDRLLGDSQATARMKRRFEAMKEHLGDGDAAARAAELVASEAGLAQADTHLTRGGEM